MKRAADLLVESLILHGVDRVFCVPGESYLSVLDALSRQSAIEVVTCRHESGAGFMALADARLSGRAGVAFVSRGPGAMNAAIALHTAEQDAIPFVLFVGQVERPHRHMKAFQEVDYVSVFGSIAKWVVEIDDPSRLPDMVASAFHAARSGTPGPVVVALPEDMLEDSTDCPASPPLQLPTSGADRATLEQVASLLSDAKRPLMIAGGLLKNEVGRAQLLKVAELFHLPVATAVRHADLISNTHPLFAGHLAYGAPPALSATLAQADLVLAVGTRLGDVTTQGYTFPAAPLPAQKLIHIWPDANAVGRIRHSDVGISGDPVCVLGDLLDVSLQHSRKGSAVGVNTHNVSPSRASWTKQLHEVALGLRQWDGPADAEDGVVFAAAVLAADRILDHNAIITIDSGNFGGWVQRFMRFGGGRTMLAPSSGAMGYGVPAAVAASLRSPEKQVVCFVGDGGFLMTGTELATAIHAGARPIIVISDNRSYGTIRMHQEKHFPGRVSATGLTNPDFSLMAQAFGALGIEVDHSNQLEGAFNSALSAGRASVISVRTSLENISAGATISALRAKPGAATEKVEGA